MESGYGAKAYICTIDIKDDSSLLLQREPLPFAHYLRPVRIEAGKGRWGIRQVMTVALEGTYAEWGDDHCNCSIKKRKCLLEFE